MRHNNKINHLGRTYSHRDAMLANMACSLIKHKRIFTTVPKAKELRKYVEPIITKSKEDTTHSRRMVFRSLQDKNVVTELFKDISLKIADRPGGYTRIIKTGHRLGDNASMCFIELVDYNENMLKTAKGGAKAAKTRRSRKKADDAELEVVAPVAEKATKTSKPSKTEVSKSEEVKATAPVVEAPIVEEQKEDTLPKENPTAE